jgi:hypothetical protein
VLLETNVPTRVAGATIAAGNIWEEEYRADGGEPQRGLTAHLWVMDPDPSKKRAFRVHPGVAFEVSGARVRVVSIDPAGVRIEVHDTPLQGSGSAP